MLNVNAAKILDGISAAVCILIPILNGAVFVLEDLKRQLRDINQKIEEKTLLLLKEEDMITLGFKTGHKRKLLAAIMRLREAPKITSKGDVAKRKRKAAKKFASKYAT